MWAARILISPTLTRATRERAILLSGTAIFIRLNSPGVRPLSLLCARSRQLPHAMANPIFGSARPSNCVRYRVLAEHVEGPRNIASRRALLTSCCPAGFQQLLQEAFRGLMPRAGTRLLLLEQDLPLPRIRRNRLAFVEFAGED